MAERSTQTADSPIDALFNGGALGCLSDSQLLERFLASGSGAGAEFDVLMARHGPMVLGICRRILRDSHAADDSFQTTFLVLVQRAQAIRSRGSLGPWLHGVARRVALRARASDSVRRELEARAAIDPATASDDSERCFDDLGQALHAEIDRLPEKYRAPVVLCYLQGRTIEEAARQLGWPAGTVGGRLARARERLRDRFVSRGFVAPAAFAAVLAADPCSASVPRALARSTRHAALQLSAGQAATAVVPAAVAKLLAENSRSTAWTRLMKSAGISMLIGALAIGAAGMSLSGGALGDPSSAQPPRRAEATQVPAQQAGNALVETLKQASAAVTELDDPQEKVDANMALAWAQIECGDQVGARASLDHAAEAASALKVESRCYARVRIAQARGEAGDRPGGLALLAQTRSEAELLGEDRPWPLKSIVLAQSELGDRDAARGTIRALDLAIFGREDRLKKPSTTHLNLLVEAQLAVGDVEEAFRRCIPSQSDGGKRPTSSEPRDQAWMLANLASAAADDNSQSHYGLDPPRRMTADEKAIRLAIVRRAVAAAETLPDASSRSSLAASLGQLGAFDEAVKVARRIDQKRIQDPRQIDAIWALWRISLDQAKAGNLEAARATLREATRVQTPPKADAQESRARLGYGFVAAKDFDEARKISETLDANSRAEILSKLARQKLREGDLKWANFLVRRALKDADEFLKTPPPPRGPELPPPMAGGGEGGPDQGGDADSKPKHLAEALSLRARIHARVGDWDSAGKAFAGIPPKDPLRGRTAFWIASLRAHSGDAAGALAWARLLPSASLRAWAIRGLAVAIFDKQEAEQQ